MCALGICMALLERTRSGEGQVIDANITEGTAYVSSWIWNSLLDSNQMKGLLWPNPGDRTPSILDSPFYGCYRTKDNKFMAVGALEPQFYELFAEKIGLNTDQYNRLDFSQWNQIKEKISEIFATKTQTEWNQVFEGTDACVTPVLDFESAPKHDHNRTRNAFFSDGTPKPSPILSRTPAVVDDNGSDEVITKRLLLDMKYSEEEISQLVKDNVIDVENRSKL